MEEKKYRYLMKIAIDFGSTNTVMAWRVYDVSEDGKLVVSEKLNPINTVKTIPSIMIFQEENQNNEAVKKDLCGIEADNVIRSSNIPPVVCDNFKQNLYTAESASEEYSKSVELTTRFFGFLREIYRQEIYNCIPSQAVQNMKTILYLSTPVRANPTHRSLMRKIAADAGFDQQNGVNEICTDYDEARCVVRYAMAESKDGMKDIMAKAGEPGGVMLLFIDVGGSTMDVSLENLRIGLDGTETMDPISSWPSADVEYPLGGCLIDEAIKEYLIQNGYADKDFTSHMWQHSDGKYRFRIFKEENNQKLAQGQEIEKLGMLANVCYDYAEDIIPEKNYNKSTEKIDAAIFQDKISKNYIEHMIKAIETLFQNQRPLENRPPVEAKDVDAVFLAGAGSRLFFIGEVLKDERLGFQKIIKNPKMLFSSWENPSLCCALGALAEQEKIISPNYAKEQYQIELGMYVHDNEMTSYIQNNPLVLLPHITDYHITDSKIGSCKFVFSKRYNVTEKYKMLPVGNVVEEEVSYLDTCADNICLQIRLFRISEDGSAVMIGMPYTKSSSRRLGQKLGEFAKKCVANVAYMEAKAVALTVDSVAALFKKKPNLDKKVDEVYNNQGIAFELPHKQATMTIEMKYALTEKSEFKADVKIKSPYFEIVDQKFQIEL